MTYLHLPESTEVGCIRESEQSQPPTGIPAMALRNRHSEALTDPNFQDNIAANSAFVKPLFTYNFNNLDYRVEKIL